MVKKLSERHDRKGTVQTRRFGLKVDGEKVNQIQSRLLLERVIKPFILNMGVNFEVDSLKRTVFFGEFRNSDFVRQKWYVLNDGKEMGMASYSSGL